MFILLDKFAAFDNSSILSSLMACLLEEVKIKFVRVVDDAATEKNAECEDFHINISRSVLFYWAKALGVDDEEASTVGEGYGPAPDPESFGAGVDGGADLEACHFVHYEIC